ncbi:glycosyltransferase family 4 protein [Solicola gregarius]|uniref:Glycosyltransferase family 4 protein n=1 Tax=Solicola gregarius TaxID=2908642 RepID=A0AA46THU6_9ACTN|nr:glycosyltransferase family 4 protein [Solicola gregarius]UYM04793.1 glycosyltransferase family 4 protein [Solicola gregarius]
MRVGMVCPYSLAVPGGVQNHVQDLTESLLASGHEVSVLAPADDEKPIPGHVTSAGRAVPVRYNGAVARLAFGPVAMRRTRRWMREGDFDVLHIHEPTVPSVSLISLGMSTCPVVATTHNATPRLRAMAISEPVLRPALEKISARIAVSEHAKRFIDEHTGGEAVIIPNGLYAERFAGPRSTEPDVRTIVFLGRYDEPRKGLTVLVEALDAIVAECDRVRLVIAGVGREADARARLPRRLAERVRFAGPIDDHEKAALLRGADLYVAPNTGGESFGIVLIEAMAAGAPVVASDLPAFATVLEQGRLGRLFRNGDAASLARTVLDVLADPEAESRAKLATDAVWKYDWSVVTGSILRVYDAVVGRTGGAP